MKRAVAIEAGDIGGPNHGIFCPSGNARSAVDEAVRAAVPQRASSASGRRAGATSWASVSTKPVGSAIACSTIASQAALPSRVDRARPRRGRLVGPEQVGDLGGDGPAGGRAWASPSRRRRSSRPATALRSWSPSAVEVGQQALEQVVHRCLLQAASAVEGARPLVEDPAAPAGVVGDGVGQAEPADQVEGGLHQLADAGPGLVGAEQLDGEPVRLAAHPLLERRDLGEQRLVGARRDPQLERGGEDRRGEVVAEHLQHRPGAPRRRSGSSAAAAAELGSADLGEVLDGGDDQVVLGREVVQLGAAADARALGDQRGRRAAEPALDQAVDGRLEQPRPHGAGALLLGDADGRRAGHACQRRVPATNSQA